MTFTDAIRSGFANYLNFSGRAARPELWWWILFVIIGDILANVIDAIVFGGGGMMMGAGLLGILFTLATLIPGIAVQVRRLHDLDRSGWWLLIVLIPLIGLIVLIYWYVQPGTPGTNQFGPPPTTVPALSGRRPALS
jgi:uncharacterized membrane protein YhaH (DUF805 family)